MAADPVTQMSWGQTADGEFRHQAVYYRAPDGYLGAVLPFIRAGLARSEPVLVAVPPPAARLLRTGLGRPGDGGASHDGAAEDGSAGGVTFADMTELGRNPGRIISAVWEFISRHAGRPVRFLGEPLWPARTAAEAREATRHEALINVAFAAAPVTVLCPYDEAALAPRLVASAGHTHPVIGTLAEPRPSPDYAGGRVPRASARPLTRPPARAEHLAYRGDLRAVRDFVARFAQQSGLDPDRAGDLVLAVGELAANTLRHTSGGGVVHAWRAPGEVICQVTDQGRISDPLVGRRRPPDASGLGVWVVHQICDLVELRTGRSGTAVRVHMRTGTPAARA
jgi:anti-sigma regulatory factor (Ser/Thr protein kinase)